MIAYRLVREAGTMDVRLIQVSFANVLNANAHAVLVQTINGRVALGQILVNNRK